MIGIYYIATGPYTQYFKGFLDTLPLWFSEEKKVVSLISSGELEEYNGYDANNIKVEYHHIQHLPWPIVTLYKLYLIGAYKVNGARLHFYFNANILFTEECKAFDFSAFADDTLTLVQPAHGEITEKVYAQGGAFCVPEKYLEVLCGEHTKRVNLYMQEKFKVPVWHDETILNEIKGKFPYAFFPDNLGIRWIYYDHSPEPKRGLCYLRDKEFQDTFKTDYK